VERPLNQGLGKVGALAQANRTDVNAGQLRGGGPVRSTRQKRALAEVLNASESFRSAQDLHAELRARGENVGLTTVYNQLKALAEEGKVDCLRADDGGTLYRRCGAEHHHHLVCRECGRTIEVTGPEVERWAEDVARANGFSNVQHTLEIVGTCRDCARPA
jgi:Fur family ferric uptake transcriptional regulator